MMTIKTIIPKRQAVCIVLLMLMLLISPALSLADVRIFASDPAADESGNDGRFTVTMAPTSLNPTTVSYTVTGSAGNGVDYTTLTGAVIVPANTASVFLDVVGSVDAVLESPETVIVTLTGADNGISIDVGNDEATVTIADNNSGTVSVAANDADADESGTNGGQFTITSTVEASTATTVNYEMFGSAANGSDYTISGSATIAAGAMSTLLDLTVLDDAIVEPPETAYVVLRGTSNAALTVGSPWYARVTIRDDALDKGTVSIAATDASADESGSNNGQFTISQDIEASTVTTVNFTVSGTAANGSDYSMPASVSIAAGDMSALLDVTVLDDSIVEPDETVIVALTSTSNAVIPVGAPDKATVTIVDDGTDTASISIVDAKGLEGGSVAFTATLDNPVQGGFTVAVDFSGNTATDGTDYDNTSLNLSFTGAAGEDVAFSVGTVDDLVIESDETFSLAFRGAVAGYAPAGSINVTATATGTILNNDYRVDVSSGKDGTVSGGGVTAPVDTHIVVPLNDTPSFVAAVDDTVCYHIDSVTASGNAQSVPAGAITFSYMFPPVSSDQSISATFAVNEYDITTTVLALGHGTVTSSGTVECRDTYDMVVQADKGYYISWIKQDGVELAAAVNGETYTWSISGITSDHTVEVAFSQLITVVEESQFGDITPAGSGTPAVEVAHYMITKSFDIHAFADPATLLGHNGHDHHISDILIDGTSIGTIKGTSTAADIYDFTNVTEDHSIEVLFTSYVDVTINGPGTVTSNGFSLLSVTTAVESYEVESGDTATFAIAPAAGYHVASMGIDGAVKGYASTWSFIDVVNEDHTLAVTFEPDEFTLEPVSNFKTIFSDAALTTQAVPLSILYEEDGTFYVKLTEPNNFDYTIAVVGLLVDNVEYAVPTAFDTPVSYPAATPYLTLTRKELNTPSDVAYAEYLEVTFTDVIANHRLEVLDYDTTPLADVPLDTRILPQAATIMFVMDDSGSMDWEFITSSSDGLFGGDYYLYNTSDRLYSGVVDSEERKEWQSQWAETNKMYYSPAVTYSPWPTFFGANFEDADGDPTDRIANANLNKPRSHPWYDEGDTNKINMNDSWVDFGGGGTSYSVISLDEGQGEVSSAWDYNVVLLDSGVENISPKTAHHTETVTVVNDNSRLTVWTTYTSDKTDMMARILDASGNEYRSSEYKDKQNYDGGVWDDDSGNKWNPKIELTNVPAGLYTIDFVSYVGKKTGTFNYYIEVAEPGVDSHHTETVTVANNNSRLTVWTTYTTDNINMMVRILDASGNEYRSGEYNDRKSWGGAVWDDDSGSDRNAYIQLTGVAAGTYTLDFVSFEGGSSGTFDFHIQVEESQTADKNILFAHYYAMHDNGGAGEQLYLINISNPVEYYKVTSYNVGTTYERLDATDLLPVLPADVPSDVTYYPPTGAGTSNDVYVAERQNFVNWFSFYRKRELTATAAIATFIKRVDNVYIGFNSINNRLVKEPRPVQVIDGMEVKNDRSAILKDLYGMVLQANGTPLRRGLEDVGEFYQVGGSNGGIPGTSPFAAAVDGDECKQVFSIVMTDGYWNGGDPSVGDADNDGWSNSLADVAEYYYDMDMAPAVADEVPGLGNDRQHMATYTVAFGVAGNLDPATDVAPTRDSSAWYAGTTSQDKIDDLWHAAVNGRGEFFSASRPDKLVASLLYIMEDIMGGKVGSGASVSVNGDEFFQTIGDDIRVYQTSYASDDWTGDVRAFSFGVDADGKFDGSRDLDWSAQEELDGVLNATGSNHATVRNIVTYDPGTNIAGVVAGHDGRSFSLASLTDEQAKLLVPYWDHDRSADEVLNYLRGAREFVNLGEFRERKYEKVDPADPDIVTYEDAWLGDFVDSRPLYAVAPGDAPEEGLLYVGSNDGMLHAFIAAGTGKGNEVFAYVPNLVFENLRDLPDPAYEHKFYVNGTMVTHTIGNQLYLVGGLGKGGKGYYSLNITNASSAGSESDAAALMNWEYPGPVLSSQILSNNTFTFKVGTAIDGGDRIEDSDGNLNAAFDVGDYIRVIGTVDSTREVTNDGAYKITAIDVNGGWLDIEAGSLTAGCGNGQDIIIRKTTSDPDMGYSYGKPIAVRSNSTIYPNVAILANGYGSETGTASLKILDLATGELIRTLETKRGPFNGLSTPRAVDVNSDLRADYVYAGDLRGNMWKFDLTSNDADNWQVAYCQTPDVDHCKNTGTVPEPLFTAGAHQAITGAPDIMRHRSYVGYMVIFGTGRYLGMTDLDNLDIQSTYGIWDWAPDDYDTGYLGFVSENPNGGVKLSAWTATDVGGNPTNTLLRQEVWCEGEITLGTVSGYFRVPSNFAGDWSLESSGSLDITHPIYNKKAKVHGADQFFMVPVADLGWYYNLPGKLTDNAANNHAAFVCCEAEKQVDGLGGPITDKWGDYVWQCKNPVAAPGGRDMGERVTSDTIIRNERAITVSFMREGARCSGGLYSFLNYRDADTGGSGHKPILTLTDNPTDPQDIIDIELIPTDEGRTGHLYPPVIIRDEKVEGKAETEKHHASSSTEAIETVEVIAEPDGFFYWKQVE